ncbi:MAG: CAP domain-containing protein [Myxococcota bacterium]
MKRLLLFSLVVGCGAPESRPVAPAPDAPLKAYTPSGPAAARYGAVIKGRKMSDFRRALSERVSMDGDARLDRVAEDLVALYVEYQRVPTSAIEFLLQHYGIAEPAPGVISIRTAADSFGALAQSVSDNLKDAMAHRAPKRYGAAIEPIPGGYAVVVILQENTVRLRPVEKQLGPDDVIEIRGELPAGYSAPALYRTRPGGAVEQPVLVEQGKRFHAAFQCQKGRNQVELTGVGQFGVTVLANFPVYCAAKPPAAVELDFGEEDAGRSDKEIARAIFDRANKARQAVGLATFSWSSDAALVAGRHSADMRDADFVGHVSPTTGGPADRTKSAGIKVSLVLENVARAPSVKEAHAGLMNSPGHRANILSDEATHLGVGVRRRSNGELLVTQMFFRIPQRQNVTEARRSLLEKIAVIRKSQGKPEWKVDETLEAVATEYAQALARSRGSAKAPNPPMLLAKRYRSMVTAVEVVGSPNDFVGQSVERRGRAGFGLGISQGEHKELGANVLYVVILIGVPHPTS